MPKHEFLTPKAIANRIKAKGLQKLRWYCQLCQKQCRDENGFKCHMMSESHQRQMLLFQNSANKVIDGYSKEFKDDFIRLLSHRFNDNRVFANVVYNEYIKDRHHIHMNATVWTTLTDFVKWLGREGICKVDETPKGWYVQYINRDDMKRREAEEKKQQMELDDVERQQRSIKRQIARDSQQAGQQESVSEEDARRLFEEHQSSEKGLSIKLKSKKGQVKALMQAMGEAEGEGEGEGEGGESESGATKAGDNKAQEPGKSGAKGAEQSRLAFSLPVAKGGSGKADSKKRKAHEVLEELMVEQQQNKKAALHSRYSSVVKVDASRPWVMPGIIVKVMSKVANGKYYKKKGVVRKVVDDFVGVVRLLDDGATLQVDQEDLETVIPAVGGLVKFVAGPYRGQPASLVSIEVEKFVCDVRLKGAKEGTMVRGVEYHHVCKAQDES